LPFYLDSAGVQIRIGLSLRAGAHPSGYLDNILVTQRSGLLVRIGIDIGVKNDLGQAPAVAQINKYQPPMIASPVHPTGQRHFKSLVLKSKLVAGMCS
jgi:hypothetical protein